MVEGVDGLVVDGVVVGIQVQEGAADGDRDVVTLDTVEMKVVPLISSEGSAVRVSLSWKKSRRRWSRVRSRRLSFP
jgi:hypothetical protein